MSIKLICRFLRHGHVGLSNWPFSMSLEGDQLNTWNHVPPENRNSLQANVGNFDRYIGQRDTGLKIGEQSVSEKWKDADAENIRLLEVQPSKEEAGSRSHDVERISEKMDLIITLLTCGIKGNRGKKACCKEIRQAPDEQAQRGNRSSQTLHNSSEQLPGHSPLKPGEPEIKKRVELRKLITRLDNLFRLKIRRNRVNRDGRQMVSGKNHSVATFPTPMSEAYDRHTSEGTLESVRSAERLGVITGNSIAIRDSNGHLIEVQRRLSDEEVKVGRAAKVEMAETERDRHSVSDRIALPKKTSNSLEKIDEQDLVEEEELAKPNKRIAPETANRPFRRRCSQESANLGTISE